MRFLFNTAKADADKIMDTLKLGWHGRVLCTGLPNDQESLVSIDDLVAMDIVGIYEVQAGVASNLLSM